MWMNQGPCRTCIQCWHHIHREIFTRSNDGKANGPFLCKSSGSPILWRVRRDVLPGDVHNSVSRDGLPAIRGDVKQTITQSRVLQSRLTVYRNYQQHLLLFVQSRHMKCFRLTKRMTYVSLGTLCMPHKSLGVIGTPCEIDC